VAQAAVRVVVPDGAAVVAAAGVLVRSLAVVPTVYVAIGLRHYLRLTHARAVAVVSVLVAFLFVLTVVAAIQYWHP
jgi:hypothetical protein